MHRGTGFSIPTFATSHQGPVQQELLDTASTERLIEEPGVSSRGVRRAAEGCSLPWGLWAAPRRAARPRDAMLKRAAASAYRITNGYAQGGLGPW